MITDAEKLDVLKFISKTHRDIHDGRIKRELYVVITTLSFYATCVVFKYRFMSNNNKFNYAACSAIIAIAIFVFIYLKSSGESNHYNQGKAEECEKILLITLKESNVNNLTALVNELLMKIQDPDKFIRAHIEKTKNGHPSNQRWLWQTIMVFSGAFISIVLFDCFKIGFSFYLIIMIYIITYLLSYIN